MPATSASARGLGHELISASAGSGKTYQLVRRYLHLLALGVEPHRIVAMTFTRKAAGEFFNRILAQLARLAVDPAKAADYFKDLQPPVPTTVDYAGLLQRLTRQTPRLRLGTLDSFFSSIANCFPLETGLPATASMMDEDEAARVQMEILDELLDRMQSSGSRDAPTQLLIASLKTASFSSEPKSLEELLRTWVKNNHPLWINSTDATVWGDLTRLWPDDGINVETDALALQALARRLRDLFPSPSPSGAKALEELIDQVLTTTPGLTPPKRVVAFLETTGEHLDALLRGSAQIVWGRRPTEISGETAQVWLQLARGLCRREFLVRAQRARGLAGFLAAYETLYHQRVRSQGRLSFADIPMLLGQTTGDNPDWPGDDLWFRLDSRFDHWMLDEFQDTSHSQWRVTERLVSEVFQDDSGQRSFFAVGDVKQSIYLWRQAEPELFARLIKTENIHLGKLTKSYRSAPPVLEAVNQVFSDAATIEELLPGSTANWFFEAHESAQPKVSGYAALLQMNADVPCKEDKADSEEDSAASDFSSSARAAAALIQELRPLERGLSCAVITRSNKVVIRLANELRALTGLSVVTESKSQPAIDNAPVLALLSLLQLAAHPEDKAAAEHLRMSPLRSVVETPQRSVVATALSVADAVFDRGFTAFALEWSARLQTLLPELDAFHQQRLAAFADLCAHFDESGSRDLDRFLDTARSHQMSRPTGTDAVQVMTVHKSKGLEFDIVIMAEMGRDAMNRARASEWRAHQEAGRVTWVLQNPTTAYVEADPVLRVHHRQAQAAAGFESLCVLYVTMTRAKRGLYLLNPPPPKDGKSMKADAFLRHRLGSDPVRSFTLGEENLAVLWQSGDPDWYLASPPRVPEPPAPPPPAARPLREVLRQNQSTQRRRTPSGEEDFRVPGRVLFSPGRDAGRRLGSRVHELLAEVEWWRADANLDPLMERWRTRGWLEPDDPLNEPALNLVRPALQDPALASVFAAPASPALVWREKPFDFIDEGGWISGVFDRVVLELDDANAIACARLIDFKTDETPDAAALAEKTASYAPQLALYRRAVARLTGLAPDKVTSHLLFLRSRRLVQA